MLLSSKMQKLTFIVLLMVGVASSQNFVSNVSKVGTTAGEILSFPGSARGMALGNAVGGLTEDATVFFWNPASAATVKSLLISASYLPWFVDTRVQHFSVVVPLRQQFVLGAFISTWSMDDMPVRTEIEQEGTGQFFDAGDMVIAVSAARALTDRFAIGANIKYVQERIWHSVARGTAIDFGTSYTTNLFNGLKVIVVLSNYGTDMQMDGRDMDIVHDPDPTIEGNNNLIPAEYGLDVWSLPLNFRFGLATDIIKSKQLRVSAEVDAIHPSNNYEAIDAGVEISLWNSVFLRLGSSSLQQDDSIEGFSLGGGVIVPTSFGSIAVDYGYRDFGHLGFLQAVTISFTS